MRQTTKRARAIDRTFTGSLAAVGGFGLHGVLAMNLVVVGCSGGTVAPALPTGTDTRESIKLPVWNLQEAINHPESMRHAIIPESDVFAGESGEPTAAELENRIALVENGLSPMAKMTAPVPMTAACYGTSCNNPTWVTIDDRKSCDFTNKPNLCLHSIMNVLVSDQNYHCNWFAVLARQDVAPHTATNSGEVVSQLKVPNTSITDYANASVPDNNTNHWVGTTALPGRHPGTYWPCGENEGYVMQGEAEYWNAGNSNGPYLQVGWHQSGFCCP